MSTNVYKNLEKMNINMLISIFLIYFRVALSHTETKTKKNQGINKSKNKNK